MEIKVGLGMKHNEPCCSEGGSACLVEASDDAQERTVSLGGSCSCGGRAGSDDRAGVRRLLHGSQVRLGGSNGLLRGRQGRLGRSNGLLLRL